MPVMHFTVRWPDAQQTRCYSPSLVIRDHLVPGTRYPVGEFVTRSREALTIASERVREKYGFACSAAMDQLARIEHTAAQFDHWPDAGVDVIAFDDQP